MGALSSAAAMKNAETGRRQQDLSEKQQELAEKYMPWQIGTNIASGVAGAAGGIMQGAAAIESNKMAQEAAKKAAEEAAKKAAEEAARAGTQGIAQAAAAGASDERLKDILAPAEQNDPIGVWAQSLNPFYYVYKEGSPYEDGGKLHLGISAQELQQLPGVESVEVDEDGFLVVDPGQQVLVNTAMIASLSKAVLELRHVLETIVGEATAAVAAPEANLGSEPEPTEEAPPVEAPVQAECDGGSVAAATVNPEKETQMLKEGGSVYDEARQRNASNEAKRKEAAKVAQQFDHPDTKKKVTKEIKRSAEGGPVSSDPKVNEVAQPVIKGDNGALTKARTKGQRVRDGRY
jgi:hypothetical protein